VAAGSHFLELKSGDGREHLPWRIVDTHVTAQAAGVLVRDPARTVGLEPEIVEAFGEQLGQMHDLGGTTFEERFVVHLPGSRALGAGSHHHPRTARTHQLHVVSCQRFKAPTVSVPQQIVAAATLLR